MLLDTTMTKRQRVIWKEFISTEKVMIIFPATFACFILLLPICKLKKSHFNHRWQTLQMPTLLISFAPLLNLFDNPVYVARLPLDANFLINKDGFKNAFPTHAVCWGCV